MMRRGHDGLLGFQGTPGHLLAGSFGAIGVAVSQLCIPFFLGAIVDQALIPKDQGALTRLTLLLACAALATALFQSLHDFSFGLAGERSLRELQQQLLTRVLKAPLADVEKERQGRLQTLLTASLPKLASYSRTIVGSIIRTTAQLLGLLVLLFWVHGAMALAVLIVAPLYSLLPRVLTPRIRNAQRDLLEVKTDLNTRFQETLRAVRELKSFGRESWALDQLTAGFELRGRWTNRAVLLDSATWFNYSLSLLIGAAAYWLGGQQVMAGALSVGELVTLVAILGYLESPLSALTRIRAQLEAARAAAIQVSAWMEMPAQTVPAGPCLAPSRSAFSLECRRLTFSYHAASEPVLDNVSFCARPGDWVGLVGPSGSGKSTLVGLLSGLYPPTSGEILIGGVDLCRYDRSVLHQDICIVAQHPVFFPASLAENIRFGRPDIDEVQIQEACALAGAHEFIQALPGNYSFRLGDGGSGLSGGQRQRLALARGLVGDPALLILDEATSALDLVTESKILGALKRARHRRSTLMVTHRLQRVETADLILVLDQGRLVARGTHEELSAGNEVYSNLYNLRRPA